MSTWDDLGPVSEGGAEWVVFADFVVVVFVGGVRLDLPKYADS